MSGKKKHVQASAELLSTVEAKFTMDRDAVAKIAQQCNMFMVSIICGQIIKLILLQQV